MDKSTFIKVDRNITSWQWFKCPTILQVFLWLLVNSNIKNNYFLGVEIKRGQLATSYNTICKECNLSKQNVITILNHLKSSGEIETKIYKKFQLITIVNYEKYQGTEQKKGYDNINEL